jgi:type II secretory pathway component PulK
VKDGRGGWERLKNKLSLNNLNFQGSHTPPSTAATKDAIQDLTALVQAEGADVSSVPKSAMTFANLMQALEAHGLIKTSTTASGPVRVTSSVVELSLSDAHRSAVSTSEKKRKGFQTD